MSVCQGSSPVTKSVILFVTQTTWNTIIFALYTKEEKASLTEAHASPSAEPQSPSVGTTVRPIAACVLPTQIVWQLITMGPARLLGSSQNIVLSPSVLQ